MSSTGVIAFTGKRSWKNIPILSLVCVGFFFYPQKVFMLYYTQFFFLRDFFEKKKGAALKISELRLTNEFPWLYKILSNAAKKRLKFFRIFNPIQKRVQFNFHMSSLSWHPNNFQSDQMVIKIEKKKSPAQPDKAIA